MINRTVTAVFAAALTGTILNAQPPENAIADAIRKAAKNGQTQVKIAPGTYRQKKTITLDGIKNLSVDAAGVTLQMTSPTTAIRINGCSGLTIKGLTLDYDPLPFTQATVTAIAADRQSFSFRVHDGYPRLSTPFAVNRAHLFDGKTRLWKNGAADLYGKVVIDTPDTGTFKLNRPEPQLTSGDMIVINLRLTHGFHIGGLSSNIRFEDVTILTSPGLGICGRFNLGDDYFRVTIKRGPKPTGATEDRLFSTAADAFNYAYTRKGPTLDRCDFSFMGDDSVNLHTAAMPIIKYNDATIITARPQGREEFPEIIKPGDDIRILAPDNFNIVGTAKIKSFRDSSVKLEPNLLKSFYPVAEHRASTKFTVYEVAITDLQGTIPSGAFFDIPAIAASGYKIINSSFHDHRGRGLRLMSSDGLIENNSLARIKHAAISVGGEYAFWREAGWVNNITIRNNRLSDIGTGSDIVADNSYVPGALAVFAQLKDYRNVVPANQNIIISGNTVEKCPVPGIFVYAADRIDITGNRLIDTCNNKTAKPGSKFGFKAVTPLSVNNSVNVKTADNRTE